MGNSRASESGTGNRYGSHAFLLYYVPDGELYGFKFVMKHVFMLFCSLLSSIVVLAQGGPIATLYHGDDFKIYHSGDALKQAVKDAESGDIITLGPGMYSGVSITKAITIRGAGMGAVDSLHSATSLPTIIDGDVTINVTDSISGYTLNVEGVVFKRVKIENLAHSVFAKTRFDESLYSDSKGIVKDVSLFHCIINRIDVNGGYSIYNSVVSVDGSGSQNLNIKNSIINVHCNNSCNRSGNIYENCIFVSDDKDAQLTYAQAFNCLWTGLRSSHGAFYNSINSNAERKNKSLPEGTEIFIPGTYYELNVLGKTYLGSDGTELGIYGTTMPFTIKTSYPQIRKFTVSPESTSDGKLIIEFEIDADN